MCLMPRVEGLRDREQGSGAANHLHDLVIMDKTIQDREEQCCRLGRGMPMRRYILLTSG